MNSFYDYYVSFFGYVSIAKKLGMHEACTPTPKTGRTNNGSVEPSFLVRRLVVRSTVAVAATLGGAEYAPTILNLQSCPVKLIGSSIRGLPYILAVFQIWQFNYCFYHAITLKVGYLNARGSDQMTITLGF